MKNIFLIILLSFSISWSQSNKFVGIIKDSETLQPITYVNIFSEDDLKNNTTGTISNENGEFIVENNKTKISFSHISYENLTIDINTSQKEIFLKPKNYILDEIVVSNINPRDYLKKIMSLSNARLDKNTLLKSYCREIVKVNNEFTKYSDALVDYAIQKGNGKSVLTLKQSRTIQNNKLDNAENESIESKNSAFDIRDYVKKAYNFEYIQKLLENDDYEFERRIKKEANGEEYEFVEIIPKAESDEMLNTGYIIIDQKTNSIIEFKIYSSENHLKNAKTINLLIAKVKVNKKLIWSKFKIIGNQYVLIYNKKQVAMHIKIGSSVNHDFDYLSDLFVYEFKNNEEIPVKGYNKKTIFEAGNNFTEKFWTKYNVFPLGADIENFISLNQK